MKVVIPHQTQILKLVNFQKTVIKALQKNGLIMYQSVPLWIPLLENDEELKSFSKNIISVKILSPEILKDEIASIVEIKTKDFEYKTRLSLISFYNSEKQDFSSEENKESLKKICTETELFPCMLKIFRLGKTAETSDKTKALSESLWVKLL